MPSAVATVVGINIAATTLVAAITLATLSNQWNAAETLGRHSVMLEQHSASLAALEEYAVESKERDDRILEAIAELRQQLSVSQSDVGTLMANAGVPLDPDVSWVSIGDEVVGFPETAEAAASLRERAFEPVQITPALEGFALDPQTAAIVRATIANAATGTEPATGVIQ